jgi:hypothetical protein
MNPTWHKADELVADDAERTLGRLLNHTLPLSPDLQDHRMHHPLEMRTATMTEVTKICVDRFEMRNHTSSSATKNITILSHGVEREGYRKISSRKVPRQTEDNGHRFQSKSRASVLVEVLRLPRCDELGTQTRRCCSFSAPSGSSFCLERLWQAKRRPITILPTPASIDMLAICVGDVKIWTWLALVILLLRVEMTTPGMARIPMFAESTTADWDIVHVKL